MDISLLLTYGVDAPGMAARFTRGHADGLVSTSTWRVYMRHAAGQTKLIDGDLIVFRDDMSYRECQGIIESFERGRKRGIEFVVHDSLINFIENSQTLINEKFNMGTALKCADSTYPEEFGVFREVVDSAMVRPLRDKQAVDAFYMAAMRRAANFSVPGSGKTASVLGAFSFLQARDLVDRVVVVCPKNAFISWRDEWVACFGARKPLRCFCLGDKDVASRAPEERRRMLALDTGACNLFLLNYEALGNYLDELAKIVPSRTLLVFDEVHRVKGIEGQRAGWALEVASNAKFVITMTGTPIPNTYKDIYNMLHLMYPADYDSFFSFEPGYLADPTPAEVETINERLFPFFCRTNKGELGVPVPNPDDIIDIEARAPENELFNILRAAYRKSPLALIIRLMQLASDPQMLRSKIDPDDYEFVLDQVGERIDDLDFVDFSDDVPELLDQCGKSVKVDACESEAERLVSEGKSVIVWCIFVRTINRVVEDLCALGIRAAAIYGATPQDERDELLRKFKSGAIDVLVTNPHTLGESVSLHNVCHDALYLEYSYNLVHLLQSKDRINRLGLPPGQYTQYRYFQTFFTDRSGSPYSLDEKIYERLREKEQVMIDAIDRGELVPGFVDDEDAAIVLGELLGE